MKLFNRALLLLAVVPFFSACIDNDAIVDTNHAIIGSNWSYINKVKIPVQIADESAEYSLFINLRHTGDYKYSNIFLLIHQVGPEGKRITERKEFKLANPDGEWLGSGSGNLYSYQLPYKEALKFSKKGNHVFEIEQNMRDNPLKEITDVGIRLERVNK